MATERLDEILVARTEGIADRKADIKKMEAELAEARHDLRMVEAEMAELKMERASR